MINVLKGDKVKVICKTKKYRFLTYGKEYASIDEFGECCLIVDNDGSKTFIDYDSECFEFIEDINQR